VEKRQKVERKMMNANKAEIKMTIKGGKEMDSKSWIRKDGFKKDGLKKMDSINKFKTN
jgi:hypothetical protein